MTPKERTAIRRIAEHLTGRDHGYGAYESDPIEAMLHETGHVVCALGLTGAQRERTIRGRSLSVSDSCEETGDAERNEAEALAWEFLVARRLGVSLDEDDLVRDAEIGERGVRLIDRVLVSRKVCVLAQRFAALVRKEARKR